MNKIWSAPIVSLLFVCVSLAQFPEFPPDNVTHTMDRDQMLWQLGLTMPELPLKTEDPKAPEGAYPADPAKPDGNWTDSSRHTITRSGFGLWNNYDDGPEGYNPGPEAWRVGEYTPIDLLKNKDGSVVKSAGVWWQTRRQEIRKDVTEQLWGVIPPDNVLPKVNWSVTRSETNEEFVEKDILGTIDISRYPDVRDVPQVKAVLRLPADSSKAYPVMVIIGHPRWTTVDRYWKYAAPNGWGVCVFDCMALQPDRGAGLTSYLIGLCNKGHWRKPTDWGALGAWSWGVSRLIDYFEQETMVDATRIGVTGHSRWGKATLVTMAYETRLAIAFPSCAGSLGTKMNRRHWGQDLENSGWDREYHWTAGHFFKWMGPLNPDSYLPRKIENCPVDAHSLLSLCAPRPVFMNAGTQDSWTDPYGIYLTGVSATPVYELLGKQGLIIKDSKPQIDRAYIEGSIGYRYHEGGHTDAPDWPAFFEFAQRHLK